jgi:hypothetical protein
MTKRAGRSRGITFFLMTLLLVQTGLQVLFPVEEVQAASKLVTNYSSGDNTSSRVWYDDGVYSGWLDRYAVDSKYIPRDAGHIAEDLGGTCDRCS